MAYSTQGLGLESYTVGNEKPRPIGEDGNGKPPFETQLHAEFSELCLWFLLDLRSSSNAILHLIKLYVCWGKSALKEEVSSKNKNSDSDYVKDFKTDSHDLIDE